MKPIERIMTWIGVTVVIVGVVVGCYHVLDVIDKSHEERATVKKQEREQKQAEYRKEGFDCGARGIPETACPYTAKSYDYHSARENWLKGWIEGHREYKEGTKR